MKIAIVGCGTAGPAAGLFLSRRGHDVTVFERVEDPGPVGAGIMLQPTGMTVMRRLGLLQPVLAAGDVVERLYGVTRGGRVVLDLAYPDWRPGLFGLGLHRGALFQVLFDALKDSSAHLELGVEVVDVAGDHLVDTEGRRFGPYDLVVVADGARSLLRGSEGVAKRARPYDWGALWAIVPDPDGHYAGVLDQVYDGAEIMVGMLPTGTSPTSTERLVSLFWSIHRERVGDWQFEPWRDQVAELAPQAVPILDQLVDPEQITWAEYHDVVLKKPYDGRVLYIGDAAHAMSPQLGQGANLALYDAMVLDEVLADGGGLDEYARRRWRHLFFYQHVNRLVTPFFQSDSGAIGRMRDVLFGPMCRMPFFRGQMLGSMAGAKEGIWAEVFTDPPTRG